METYKITTNFSLFRKFLIENINSSHQQKIGVMYNGNDIYIRCSDETILSKISKYHHLTLCIQPSNMNNETKWQYLGNNLLFEAKL